MAAIYEYLHEESGLKQSLLSHSLGTYQLKWGRTLSMEKEAAYCPNCDAFVFAEYIPSISDLESRIQKIKTDIPLRYEVDKTLRPHIAELKRRIRWRKKRKSPARCLTLACYKTGVLPLPETKRFPHPATGEMIRLVDYTWAVMEGLPSTILYTPEGMVIRELSYNEWESLEK